MEWNNVHDGLPEKNANVLFSDGGNVYLGVFFDNKNGPFFLTHREIQEQVTHWMAIPKPPYSERTQGMGL